MTGETGDIVAEIWYYYDKDNSSKLDRAEILEYIEEATGQKYPETAFNELFVQYDADGSGMLEKSEIEALVKEVLKMNIKE